MRHSTFVSNVVSLSATFASPVTIDLCLPLKQLEFPIEADILLFGCALESQLLFSSGKNSMSRTAISQMTIPPTKVTNMEFVWIVIHKYHHCIFGGKARQEDKFSQ